MPILSFLKQFKKPKYDNQVIFSLQHLDPREHGFPRKGGTSLGLQERARERKLSSLSLYPAPHHKTNPPQVCEISNKSRVYIVGHGSPGGKDITGETADGQQNKWNIAELADLIQSQYKHDSKSKSLLHVSLVACYGGMNGLLGEPSIAEQLCVELHKRGITAKVTGRMGPVERYAGKEEYRKYVDTGKGSEHGMENNKQSFTMGSDGQIIRTLGKAAPPLVPLNFKQLHLLTNFMSQQQPKGAPWSSDAKYKEHMASNLLSFDAAQKLQQKMISQNMSFNESDCYLAPSVSNPGMFRVMVRKTNIVDEIYLQIQHQQRNADDLISKIKNDCQTIHNSLSQLKHLQHALAQPTSNKEEIQHRINKFQAKILTAQSEIQKDLLALKEVQTTLFHQRNLLVGFIGNYSQLSQIDLDRANQTIRLQQEAQAKLTHQAQQVTNESSKALSVEVATKKSMQHKQYTTLPPEAPDSKMPHHLPLPIQPTTFDPRKRELPQVPQERQAPLTYGAPQQKALRDPTPRDHQTPEQQNPHVRKKGPGPTSS
ncbi:MAG: hypothetical protein JSR17_12940 [Proteobacteria bacterium]|nr:hypothetical protein [Pseudomonadota bacterium]